MARIAAIVASIYIGVMGSRLLYGFMTIGEFAKVCPVCRHVLASVFVDFVFACWLSLVVYIVRFHCYCSFTF